METRLDQSTLGALNAELALETARATIAWAIERFGTDLCLLASMQDAVLIDIVMDIDRDVDVVFLDNGYHFAETLATVAQVERRYGIDVVRVTSPVAPVAQPAAGSCCDRKLPLLEAALAGRKAWMSGVRRSETSTRAVANLVDTDRRGLVKVNPIAAWTDDDADSYILQRRIITNPLLAAGYTSVGCSPCTSPNNTLDPRGGRWASSDRTECGLHL